MKNKIVIILTCCCLFSPYVSYAKRGKFWKALGKALGGTVEAASAVLVSRSIESCGYTKEESEQYTRDIYEAFGSDCSNVERGLNYMNAEDKYARQNIVKDVAFEMVGDVSENQEFVEYMRQMSDNTLSYLSANQQAKTDVEKKQAKDTLNQRSFDIMWDAYQFAKERKAERLAERLQLRDELIERGENPALAYELAGQIMIISEDESLTEQEKERYYRSFGLYDDVQQVVEIVTSVMKEDENLLAQQNIEEQQSLLEQKEEEERKRQEELRRQHELEVKAQCIAKINSTVIDSYIFDKEDLLDRHKCQLTEIAEILIKYEDLTIDLIGHTCSQGYKSVNNRIGLRRADTVKAYLVEQGISECRIKTYTKGETEPKIVSPTLEERKLNRRVEFVVR